LIIHSAITSDVSDIRVGCIRFGSGQVLLEKTGRPEAYYSNMPMYCDNAT
jgi:hypothetical protein